MLESTIKHRKIYSNIKHRSQKETKQNKCFICGKCTTDFCNSHTIPQFVLRNIENDGKFEYTMSYDNSNLTNKILGMNEINIFRIICENCDSTLFSDYEDESRLLIYPTQKMLHEIALKNTLYNINDTIYYKEINRICREEQFNKNQEIVHGFELFKTPLDLNLIDHMKEFDRLMNESTDNESINYKITHWSKLPYVIPIAFQHNVALNYDMKGNIINDITNYNKKIKMKSLYICLFPLKYESIILMFHNKDDSEYNEFDNQFKELSPEEKHDIIIYIVSKYSELLILNQNIQHKSYVKNTLGHLFGNYNYAIVDYSPSNGLPVRKYVSNKYELKSLPTIPRVLSEKYAIVKNISI